jgi:iron complex outermembrane receptor protein
MRGLGRGYTMIMINGEPAPRGFSMDSLAPEQVERIEVMRAPVAEHSARAIAGSINIVLREELVKRENDVRPGLGWEEGRWQPGIWVQKSDTLDKFNYNVGANVLQRDLPRYVATTTTAVDTRTGAPALAQEQRDQSNSRSDSLNLNARLNWRMDGGNNFVLIPFMNASHSKAAGTTVLEQSLGARPPPFAGTLWRLRVDNTMARVIGESAAAVRQRRPARTALTAARPPATAGPTATSSTPPADGST